MPALRCVRSIVVAVAVLTAVLGGVPTDASAQAHYEGALGPGSFYEIDVPAVWNGNLVLYAHGIVQASLPVVPPTNQDGYPVLRASLLASGFAVAASSYSSNGWALDDAVRRTHQLSGIFASHVGRPVRTLLLGHSLGALAIVKLIELHPSQYDGALAMCGPLGGGLAELQYAGNARVTFDYYFPDVLPGEPFNVPPGTAFLSPFDTGGPNALFLSVLAALSANPQATLQWAIAANLPFATSTELGNTALYVVGFLMRFTNDFIERVNGKMPFDNHDTVYQVNATPDPATNALLSQLLNQGVERFVGDRAALNYYNRNYLPSGQIRVPVITLHTTRDPAIPFAHEAAFAKLVTAAGKADLLLQRPIDRWGHCAFTNGEIGAAFADLVGWVSTGIRP
jgi:pimeloyl-ACP methyl ester carboxylesterase